VKSRKTGVFGRSKIFLDTILHTTNQHPMLDDLLYNNYDPADQRDALVYRIVKDEDL
jgi:hypothetical protein